MKTQHCDDHHHDEQEDLAPLRTRRAVLKAGGLGLFALGAGSVGPSFLTRAAHAAESTSSGRKVLVTIFQRGAMDGLAAVSPLGGRLDRLRPSLALPKPGADGGLLSLPGADFGLHPALASLAPLFEQEQLAIVHGMGSPDPTRSHFDAQDYMETGTPGVKSTRSGWLNRVVGELGHEGGALRAVSMTSAMPKSLYGTAPAVAVSRLEDLQLRGVTSSRMAVRSGKGFEALYRETAQELLRDAGQDTFAAMEAVESVRAQAARGDRGSGYPASSLGRSLQEIALMIKAGVGLEVAFAESGGWDTHVRQGSERGTFARQARDLGDSIAAFWKDLGDRRRDVLLMTMTEFGRTVRQNGSGGTDHGHGSCLFVLGGGVEGGRVHGDVSIAERDLYEGRDLAVTTDFRSVFASVAQHHLGVGASTDLFPGWRGDAAQLFG